MGKNALAVMRQSSIVTLDMMGDGRRSDGCERIEHGPFSHTLVPVGTGTVGPRKNFRDERMLPRIPNRVNGGKICTKWVVVVIFVDGRSGLN